MGRYSPDHDQRKGQWLVNHVRFNLKREGMDLQRYLFAMSTEEFDEIMKEGNFYNPEEYYKHE